MDIAQGIVLGCQIATVVFVIFIIIPAIGRIEKKLEK
jgi:hypothetical protein